MTGAAPGHVWMTTDALGGVWQFGLDLARGLAGAGLRVTLAVLGPAPSAAQRAEAAAAGAALDVTGLPLDWTAPDEAALASAAPALADRAAAAAANIVQLNHPAYADAGWPAPVLAVVHSCHGSWWAAMRGEAPPPPEFAWRARRMRRALLAADRAVAPSAALAGALRGIYALPQSPGVVHNGRAAVAPAGPAPAGPFVFTAGRLWDEAKNAAALDRAAAAIAAPVLAAGALEGPNGERAALRNLRPCGVLDAPTMAAHHRAAAAFVSLARYEPFGLAVLEAAQAGTPLVLSDIPTFRELWDGAALFVPADAPEAVAGCCTRLLDEPETAALWGARAAERSRRYTVAAMTGGYLREYAALAPAGGRRMAG